ncbi:Vegetative incompatibility protein HET-E-1 [Colletotrichum fructicola]|nr:Vegetative incompatibility protein HET-E-1 [Colletotrichum fructicola]KAF5496386.1 Vegetative incompatibility protein HET-E-1 [Colletotrichum fructicola]
MDENRPIRLLSLDGGGIRGVSSILVLKEVMRQVNIDRKPEDHLLPWQVFDLIGGTSTGGIIALMLGCLRMSVDECYEVYMKLSKTIFKPKRWKCNVFSRSIDLISANERFVATVRADDEELLLLRSYVNKQQPDMHSAKFEMWEALRATSAASTYFKEYRRGNEGYVDGAFKSNNPIFEVHHEAADLWPGRDVFLISIGTGTKPSAPLGGHVVKLVRSMTKLATATEGSWIRFNRTHKQLAEENRLFRFSAPGIGEVDLGNYKMIGNVAMRTETYLRDTTTARDIARCSKEMVAIQTNEYTTVHKLKDSERDCLKLLSGAGGAYESQRLSIETPVQGTCHWFLNHKAFTSWLRDASSALLWVTANPGCGKTVLSRFLVDVLSRQSSEATVCYFFFKAGEEGRHHAHQALCAILHNVFKVHAKAIECAMKEYSSNDAKNFTQNIEALWDSLCEASDSLPNKQIIVIIDALDECSEHSRNRLIDLLVSTFPHMIGSRKLLGRLKIIVTSRPWPSIESRFRYLSCVRLRGENETSSLSKDIETMVKAKVSKLKVEGTITPEACTILETSLAQGADRTFLWASLVLETISKLPSRKLSVVKSTLEVTPASLDQLYETALQGVEDRVATTKMLQIILAATRPLTLEEINLAMNISSTHETVQDLLDDLEPDVEYTVKKLGGFFVRIMNSTVYLVHQTARDFLLRIKSADSTGWKGTASADISRLLVDKGVDLQQEYPSPKRHVVENRLVLLQAVYDTKEKFEFLLSKGAAGWGDAVRSAAGSGKVEQLQLLLSAADSVAEHEKLLDLPDALKLASENGHASTRRLLLNAGVQEPEDTDISAGLVEAATLGCDEYNIRALVEDGARDVEGKALFSRASFGEVEGIRTLLSVLEYSCELVNAALLIFFDTYLDDGARGFSMKTIHKTLSSTNGRRLWNGFSRQPMIGQSQQANEEFLKLMSSRNARLPAARFHQAVCCAIAMDEKLAIFLIENRKTLQESSDMTGTYEYLALACLWGRVRIIEYLFEKDTEKGPLTLCDQLFRAVVVSGNITALDIMLHRKSASGLGSKIGFVGEEFSAYWVEVEKVLGTHDAAASPLDIAARLGYQDMVAKLTSAKMALRSPTAE